MSETVATLERLIAFDTTSRNSNLELVEYAEKLLAGSDVQSRRIDNVDGTKANLVARIGPDAPGGVVLCGHMDVVPVDGQPWNSDPFTMIEKDGLLYGRGTADMKGFIAASLAAVPAFVEAKLTKPIFLAFTYDEEVGCVGAPSLAHDLATREKTPAAVVIGEPTLMRIVRSHKGIRVVHTTVTGLDGHSSQNMPTASAIMAAGRIINRLADLSVEFRERGLRVEGFTPPHTTTNVGTIHGGQADNIVPRECTFNWEFRPVPGDDPVAIYDKIMDFTNEVVLPELRRQAPDAGVEFDIIADVPPLVPAGNNVAAATVAEILGNDEIGTPVAFGSDASHLQAVGLQSVLLGPGSIDQGHQPNEFVAVEQLDQCDQFLSNLVAWASA